MDKPVTVLYDSEISRGQFWQEKIGKYYPDVRFYVWPEPVDLDSVDVLVVWKVSSDLLEKLPNLKAIFTVSAGIDQIDFAVIPERVDIVRMIDEDLSDQLAEYAVMSALMIYRDMPGCQKNQKVKQWLPFNVPLAKEYHVGIMGLGQQGLKIIERLKPFHFKLSGWSRSMHTIEGVSCYNEATPDDFLASLNVLICVLPLTDSTRGILNTSLFDMLPEGSSVINIGRGEHLVSEDLINALDRHHLRYAILDVFGQEPLADNDPLWSHPDITITPHIAGVTRPESGFESFIKSLRAWCNGEKPAGLVLRNRGY
ncbi:2-hydroxyacid dehydrogenase [Vibrio salinus]|uniref:2-hydroxyacid dehydrogenase n=1 Tax=Vibrio salinus TaxID=2899784 RepID=UPI001E421196|nr:glyoxylate/hydroxypyruvate reductase A [Vibrio salinus]MCE0494966.1 glyoxylate/hydroxypyruvate reductase A [Vibrio salinus]